MNSDPGLQPERTAMSWLRTQLVLFALGLLFLKVTEHSHFIALPIMGFITMLLAILASLYSRYRFTQVFENNMTVSANECWIKQSLSLLIALLAIGYLAYLWAPSLN
ncbi:DUF202 domain-containing protein [Photobacterium sp. DA100]|uniref:DUF202 domain-containing protein n=1 Tax=Photobacterium sp. DA100 TaxID=3027472 RepID=UPI002479762E|nr:DUF202 domain-containing protein [Photobacterium sp. DA100]WEM41196.1 DUF202 domain-containing protein [Photobacterium sp. DA100]